MSWRRFGRIGSDFAIGLYAVATPCLLMPAGALLFAAETGRGHLAGLSAVSFLFLPIALFLAARIRRWGRRKWIPAAALGLSFLGSLSATLALSPTGRPKPGARAGSEFPGTARYDRFSPFTLVPEVDQVKVASFFLPILDPEVDGRRLRECTLPLYRALESDEEFRSLGTVMNFAIADRDAEHLYWYRPPSAAAHAPALLFLHGGVANFKVYLWAWKRLADQKGLVLVCPSFGFGHWDREGGVAAVERARAWTVAHLSVDPGRIWLAGISHGALGVLRAFSPDRYRGAILISPVLDAELRTGPALVISGAEDRRVPIGHVKERVARTSGVDFRVYPDEDHFLFLSSLDRVLADVAGWLAAAP